MKNRGGCDSGVNPSETARILSILRTSFRIVCAEKDGVAKLSRMALSTINNLINEALDSVNGNFKDIKNVVISGNTTMTHLLLKIEPRYIRREPYIPSVSEFPILKAGNIGIKANPIAAVFIMHHSEVGINLKMKAPPSVQPEIRAITHVYNIFYQGKFYQTVPCFPFEPKVHLMGSLIQYIDIFYTRTAVKVLD